MALVHYTQLTDSFFNSLFSAEDLELLNEVMDNPRLIPAMEAIIGYSKTRLTAAITSDIVKVFTNYGICIFGTSVKDAKVFIPRFLDAHPECRDADPIRCFNKIIYYLAREWHLRNPNLQAIEG